MRQEAYALVNTFIEEETALSQNVDNAINQDSVSPIPSPSKRSRLNDYLDDDSDLALSEFDRYLAFNLPTEGKINIFAYLLCV